MRLLRSLQGSGEVLWLRCAHPAGCRAILQSDYKVTSRLKGPRASHLPTLPPRQMQIRRGMPKVPRPRMQLSQVPTWTAIARSVTTPNVATLPTKEVISALGDTPWRHSVTTVATGGHGRSSRRVRRRRRSSLVVARREHPRRAWTPRCRSPHEYTLQAPSYSHRLRRNDEVDALKDDGEPGHRWRKRGLAGQGLELRICFHA